MKPLLACFVVTVAVLVPLAHAVLAEKALRLKVSPLISFEPAKLAIQVRLQPDATDRWIAVQMDSGDYYTSHDFTIEGDRTLYPFVFRDVPQGDYEVQAAVGHGDVTRASDRVAVIVRGL